VKQFEAFAMPYSDPWNATTPYPFAPGEPDTVDFWGVTWSYPMGVPGAFPIHGSGKTVLEDIEDWKNIVHTPPLEYPDELWDAAENDYASIDRDELLVATTMFPGLFESTHNLMGLENAMCSFYTNPKEMHELIEYILEWELDYLVQVGRHLHPDAVIHHDDWGSSLSTFLSPEMFAEFYLEPYKILYKAYHDNGFEIIVHHSDSYAATYVPFMIEMGVNVWQGGTIRNDIPKLVSEYGGDISFMTGVDSQIVDREDWTREQIAQTVQEICEACGKHYFVPCQTYGANCSTYEPVYGIIDEEIDRMSALMFGNRSGNA
jgi:hypothetical protein